ncbi:MAG: alcohol dehydrogenase catalytic domain-containing protein [Armatimonadota bacterium]|nr:alcohol dehydrogenase catalytic domain-containing protein [Armatimonadota bacterium]
MKAIVLKTTEHLVVQDVPKPLPGPGEALVKVTCCGVCGSDIRYLHGENPWAQHTLGEVRENPPNIIPGHEIAGVVAEVGEGVDKGLIGKRVGVLCFKVDESCPWCRRDLRHLCANTIHLGHGAGQFGREYYYGGMAEYVPIWADHCYRLPDSVSDEQAAMLDPLCVGLHAVSPDAGPGKSVLLIGAGVIGLCALQCARALGATQILAADIDEGHLAVAKRLGADGAINVDKRDLTEAVMDFTGGLGVWLVVDSVGMPLARSLPLVIRGGRLALLVVKDREETISTLLLAGERRVMTCANFDYPEFTYGLDLLASGRVNVEELITHRFPIDRGLEAFRVAESKEGGAIKVMINA